MSPLLKKLFVALALVLGLNWNIVAQTKPPHIQWANTFGGSDIDVPTSIKNTSDGGFIIAGSSGSNDQDIAGHHGAFDVTDFWVVKLDSTGNLLWQKSLGSSDDDMANAIVQTADNGYAVVGSTRSNDGDVAGNPPQGGLNVWVVRLNDNGSILWQYTYGGSNDDVGNDIIQTAEGGYIITGYSYSHDGDITSHHDTTLTADAWVIKLNKLGNLQWQKSFGGTGEDLSYSIRQTADNGYAIVGNSNSTNGDVTGNHGGQDFWIIKIDSLGNFQWEKSYGGSSDDNAQSFEICNDHSYILGGYAISEDKDITKNHGQADMWVVRLDSTGNLQWQKTLGGSETEAAYSVKQTLDGGFVCCGISGSNDGDITINHGGNDYWVVKLDPQGNNQWQESLGGPGEEFGTSIVQNEDSSFVIAGSSDDIGGDVRINYGHEDYWIIKLSYKALNTVHFSSAGKISPMNYPNPFSDNSEIRLPNATDRNSDLLVYDMLGKLVIKIPVSAESSTIKLEKSIMTPGPYVYRLVCEGMVVYSGNFIVH